MGFTDDGGRRRETPCVWIINIAGSVGIEIIYRIVEATDGVAPASTTNPVLGTYGGSVQFYRHLESELTIVEVVEETHDAVSPVVVATFYGFTVRETQPRPIGREPLGHP